LRACAPGNNHRGYEGNSGQSMFPWHTDSPGFGAQYKKDIRDHASAFINIGAFGEVLPRYESMVSIDPEVKDAWDIPVLRFQYQFSDNERKMGEDMATSAREMFDAAGIDVIGVDRDLLTEGWSIHELGTARMGNDPKTSVLNQFQQTHDIANLYVMDAAGFTSNPCQNPTLTIMALCVRSCDYLMGEMKKGSL
jgi:choline dehydrogenase-like flavoprotein